MRKSNWKVLALLMAFLVVTFTTGCRVRQTEEGEMPDVDVQVEGGKVPEYDVDAADVDVKMEEKTIKVPDVDVEPPRDGDQDPPEEEKPPQQ